MSNRIVFISFALAVSGLNLFGQTNSSTVKANAPPISGLQSATVSNQTKVVRLRRLPTKTEDTNKAFVASRTILPVKTFSADSDPAETAVFRRIEREYLLQPGGFERPHDFSSKLSSIFRSDNDQMGETSIRDTVITIFPTGR
jgi:hypothetical protein